MSNRTRRALTVATGAAVIAVTLFVGAAPSTAAPADTAAGAQQTRGSVGLPVNVSVSTSESGMTVYASPVCTGWLIWKSCRSWFVIPGYGIDKKDVTTTGGYFVPWPSSWHEGQSVSSGYVSSYGRTILGYYWGPSTSLGTITRPYSARGITARLTSQDDGARTARISGTATPGAQVRYNGGVALADQWGTWNATVGGLSIGTNTLWFEQYIDGRYHDRIPVTVTITGEIVPATVTGPGTVSPGVENTITGTATPNATFQVVDAAGTVIVPGGPFPVDAAGKWSFRHLVPAGATEFRFAIQQTAWGKPVTSELFTLPADTVGAAE